MTDANPPTTPTPTPPACPLPRAHRPCDECPWRLDQPPGRFPASRYRALYATSPDPHTGESAPLDAPLFACHKSPDGRDKTCAGWLAVAGHQHVGMRLAAAMGRLDRAAFTPQPDCPDLYPTYEAMATANHAPPPPPATRPAAGPRPVRCGFDLNRCPHLVTTALRVGDDDRDTLACDHHAHLIRAHQATLDIPVTSRRLTPHPPHPAGG